MNKEIKPNPNVSGKNKRGEWVPVVPEPYYHRYRKECDCGAKFWTIDGYRGHYAYKHILNFD